MRTLLLFLSLSFYGLIARAQHDHFVYLQTDNKQAFYVRLNEKVYSSSASGYLVIPKLGNGSHTLSVGFPKNEWPNQEIVLPVVNKDQGYILKNFGSKGWGLFNMQSMDVIMAKTTSTVAENNQAASRTDEFSTTLADVVNTPSIKDIKKEEVKEADKVAVQEPAKSVTPINTAEPVKTLVDSNAQPRPAGDSLVAKHSSEVSAPATAPVTVATVFIKRINEQKTEEGLVVNYAVQEESGIDTVQVILSGAEIAVNKEEIKDIPKETKQPELPAPSDTKAADVGSPKFIDMDLNNPSNSKDSSSQPPVNAAQPTKEDQKGKRAGTKNDPTSPASPETGELKMINSDCKTSAKEEDFLKVRKRMIAQRSDDDMISAAQKLFRQKCYSTDQVKNLSVLFLKDDSKYKFFDAAYPFVYDTPNFKNLESQLTDPYFISRFKAMIRN